MKALLYTYSRNFTTELAIDLIPMGIEVSEMDSPDAAISALKSDDSFSILLTDHSDTAFLKAAKEACSKTHLFLIANQNLKPSDLKGMVEIGITSIITFSNNAYQVADEVVKSIIANNIRTQERRAFVRVRPKSIDEALALVYVKELNRFIQGTILDISAGGVAIQMLDMHDGSYLKVKGVYEPLMIALQGMEIKTQATLVGKRGNAAGFKFDNIEAKHMRKIANYIYGRINEKPENLMKDVNSEEKKIGNISDTKKTDSPESSPKIES